MIDTAQAEAEARQKIAAAAQQSSEQVTPITAESPLEIVGEGADIVRNTAEGVGNELFGGSSVETVENRGPLSILKAKITSHLRPGEEIKEKEAK